MKKREIWLDDIRAFACILVALGHLLMSFQDGLNENSLFVSFLIKFMYHFHVYIFFFCSGYLLQKSFENSSDSKQLLKSRIIRCLDFLIVYIIFSGITYLIKVLLSGDVNSPIKHSFLDTLIRYPINQMWYMYAISIITICIPMISTKHSAVIQLIVAVILKLIMCLPVCRQAIPVPLNYLFENQIWYVLGSLCAYKTFTPTKWVSISSAVFLLVASTVVFFCNIDNALVDAILTFTGLVACVGLFRLFGDNQIKRPVIWSYVAKYMLQIYLLHTICAAGIRIVLIRLGIMTIWVHFPLGMLFSIMLPIACGIVADRTKVLNLFFFPLKTLKGYIK